MAPKRAHAIAAVAVCAAAISPWVFDPRPDAWVTWKESETNSMARRAWTRRASALMTTQYRRGDGVFTSFNDMTAIFRASGIPLRETLTGDNGPAWDAAVMRPDLFLREQWAVVMGGDMVQTAINRVRLRGPNYTLFETIIVKGAPVIEIYRRERDP